ncbi:1-pyrroline-5-carboxylate dehydrogenase [Boudabousia liubingyangii]|uniref:L-glutamate gamma-semialdehyde dehydrogenase n=1 Tax=Boudabousia liubingyangii TaxID=1921764 RepID=A0A1Q5PPY5_9ACTO|nr:bifunctional proline dehydrogenase/L-glutamate gamma-semialdehyde dehydrogenase [Boudabousia liubingyangii]OKL49614.1 1-pyrroline-5-carboxylate dehydrogenase [Boudabousia liubingyangii]
MKSEPNVPPHPQDLPDRQELAEVGELAVATAARWAKAAQAYPIEASAKLLAKALADPSGLEYTVAFVDNVIRPEDEHIAARNLAKLGKQKPGFLPWFLRLPAAWGGALAPLAPQLALPVARRVFSELVGDLVLDVREDKLGPALARLRKGGARLNVNLLGEAVLGDGEADRRLAQTKKLLERPDIDYVSLKVSAVTGPHNPWAFDQTVDRAVEKLLPLYQVAAQASTPKFINLDMEEYRDLALTIAVFKKILDRPDMLHLEAGIVLQGYLPDSLPAMKDLQEWSAARRARGGAGIKVRVVKGANLAMERVEAEIHDWPLTVCPSKADTDANYLRVLDWAMAPERMQNVRLGVAGHNLFTIAYAWELAGRRGVRDRVEIEMLSGMATNQARAVRDEVGQLLLYVPVVHPDEYDVAISYLVRRLEENAAPENYMSNVFHVGTDPQAFNTEKARFEHALELLEGPALEPRRSQDRRTEKAADLAETQAFGFANTPDSDPALPGNLEWAAQIIERVPNSELGAAEVSAAAVESEDQLSLIMDQAIEAQGKWAARPAAERAEILRAAAVELGLARAELIEVAASECGKTIDQADVEVSEAIDFANYYAQLALEVEEQPGTQWVPAKLIAVTPPWNFPLAIPAGGVLAALAAGSGVLFKPAGLAVRCGALVASALWRAGVPRELLQFVVLSERQLGKQMITDPRVERVILTGGSSTAELFRSWRPDLQLLAETSGKNAIIVTPSADLDLAVKDVVNSAFGHAGQKCSASSLVILVGSVAKSKRFARQLVDAVKSLHVAHPTDPEAQMGPICGQPGDKLRTGLTKLEDGQRWILEPKQLDDSGRLWSPGVRVGVKPGSDYHLTEYFGPILGIMQADTLEQAVQIQNATAYGLTAGIHSLDSSEVNYWLQNVEAGNLYVNRGITGAIVRRQPFGGWKRSAVGNGTKAGGPNYLFALGRFESKMLTEEEVQDLPEVRDPLVESILQVGSEVLSEEAAAFLRVAARSDELAKLSEFAAAHDPSDLACELNVFRYLPVPVTVRTSIPESVGHALGGPAGAAPVEGQEVGGPAGANLGVTELPEQLLVDSVRVCLAGVSVGAPVTWSVPVPVDPKLVKALGDANVRVQVVPEAQWLEQAAKTDWGLDGRVRLVGADRTALSEAVGGNIDVACWDGPVTVSGRIEALPFVHEQAVSITNHRFGNPTPLSEEWIV